MNAAARPTEREQILALLQQNARLTSTEIADRLALEVEVVEAIIAAAEADRSICGYYTALAEDALSDNRVRAVIEVEVNPERDSGFDSTAKRLAKFPEVTDVLLVSGSYDLQLIVEGENLQDVANFVSSKLAPLQGIRATRTHFMLKKYKEAGFILEDDEDYERLSVTP